MKSDIEIAQACPMRHIREIAREVGVEERYLEQYGNYKAKIDDKLLQEKKGPDGKLILVTAITPTPAGEGKTTTTVGLAGNPTSDIHYNPNNSVWAIEGITSPDGRVFGKMGHSERTGPGLYRNVPGDYDMKLFRAAVEYFQ